MKIIVSSCFRFKTCPLFDDVQISKSKYRISTRCPTLCKRIPTNSEKMQESVTVFKNSMKKMLLEREEEITYF